MVNELQADHFGDSISLSIEGCSLKYHLPNSVNQTTYRTAQLGLDFHLKCLIIQNKTLQVHMNT